MAEKHSNVTLSNRDLELLSLKLCAIDAQVDSLVMLATTGDLKSLKPGRLCDSLIDIGERIGEAKGFLDDLHSRALKVVDEGARRG